MRRRAIITSAITGFTVVMAILASMLFISTPAYAAGTTQQVWLTFYGWYDNTPPGAAIAYPEIHQTAGGTGTYSDPITFATDKSEEPAGTIVYVPRVGKYFIMEDDCTECDQDWSGQGPDGGPKFWHFDLWSGGQNGNEFDSIDCEDALTQGTASGAPLQESVVINPPSNETVNSTPIFNSSTNQCFGNAQPTTTTGQYKNNSTGTCLDDPSNSSTNGAKLDVAACSGAAEQQFSFNGAFMVINNLCVNNPSGSTLDLATCSGGPTEQWSINPNGTIEDVQTSTKCFRASGSTLTAGSCSGTASEWTFSGTTSTPPTTAPPTTAPPTTAPPTTAPPTTVPPTTASPTSTAGSCTSAQLLGNPGFENGTTSTPWTETSTTGSDPINNDTADEPAHSGKWDAWLDGDGTKDTDTVAQTVAIPGGCKASFSFWLHIDTTESTSKATPDTLAVQVLNSSGTVLTTLATYSNLNANSGYAQKTFSLSSYAGQSVTLKFTGTETDANGGTTDFVVDDTALQTSS